MKYFKFVVIAVTITCLICGCGSKEDESLAVAKDFWKAMKDKDIEKAKTYATAASAGALTLNEDENDQDAEITFGDIEKKDGKSKIETIIRTIGGDSEMEIPMQTVLVKEGGEWKVDVNETMMSLFGGAMGAMMDTMKESMEDLGNSMAEEMKASMEEIGKELSENNDD
jgi:hypothetical protein